MQRFGERAAHVYLDSGLARGVVNLVPYGSSVDVMLSEAFAKKEKQRVADLIREVNHRVDSVDQQLLDEDFVRSDEFESLFMRAFQAMRTTHQRDKLAAFANILAACALRSSADDAQKERYLLLLGELTSVHLLILAQFRTENLRLGTAGSQPVLTSKQLADSIGLASDEVEAFCSDLSARGLVYDALVGSEEYARGTFRLHPSANRFVDYVFSEWPR